MKHKKPDEKITQMALPQVVLALRKESNFSQQNEIAALRFENEALHAKLGKITRLVRELLAEIEGK